MAKEKIQPVRGMQDILPDEMRKYNKITETARKIADLYGFEHMATPIMESVEVFKRTLGDSSDVVNKEMYAFLDRKDRELVLRPENTASIVRAFISNGLQQSLPARFFYSGPMFRYERPQAGRQRQFHQIGVELLGESSYLADADIIACAHQVLKQFGLANRIKLQINTLGDLDSRTRYQAALVDYLIIYKNELSKDSQRRLEKNPLRILDSKDENDKKIISDSPNLIGFLGKTALDHFLMVESTLKDLGIEYEHNKYLVRGLDYYCHTVFEFVTDDLGAQGTVLAGGRYDGLVKALGGKNIEGIGWAAGVERLALLTLDEPERETPKISLACNDYYKLASCFRNYGIRSDYLYDWSPKKQKHLKHAVNVKSDFFLFNTPDARAPKGSYILLNMKNGDEYPLSPPYRIPRELGGENEEWMLRLIQALKEFNT